LNSANWTILSHLTRFLTTVSYRLPSPNLRRHYFNYYWRDCPGVVAEVAKIASPGLRPPSQESAEEGRLLRDHEPLSVLKRLADCVRRRAVVREGWGGGFPVLPGVTESSEIVLRVIESFLHSCT
jgi:hypothetical protein